MTGQLSSLHFAPSPPPVADAGKCRKTSNFNPKLHGVISAVSGHHFRHVRIGSLARDFELFRRSVIALDTHALPASVAARGTLFGQS
ncbi:hypothetical protein L3X38_023823 [Prunus dulcis]|uniref:Uncharacterized protein n=1 Tax=Prunus dulcis TaxID=3755 RepID=A0AAD4W161_PRUDU|nr:hypothetical protein L3X38_023823 [Prunus dulcis]